MILPVLVVPDKTLWSVDYDSVGSISPPQRLDEVTLYVARSYLLHGQQFVISHLHICTETGFDKLLARISEDNAWWETAFSK